MSNSDGRLNQETLLQIMLQAYQLGMQKKEIDSRMIIDSLTTALKPYFPQEEQVGRATLSTRSQQEAIG
ncbi:MULTISPECIES: hypothetical protein [Brevibacillus]|uniref:Uncharacterized protein n=1 Tax=Brevibacillus invocatus TaxID=173959 RepID=A0A3M8C1F5_9BACL|nr:MULTISPECIES: hypothetical protein [Brevibacillus]MCM3079423.1 hypothetical protein [Brevibacillus invocatus]MCM3429525.1 hypothetical protein [Brevibacillus invocatus]MDH4618240.1 hypothetical protein [Brevibacillus sp. AY1]RNB69494.1 hypothetical protein EDM52_18650 [Brevibacillus invocatus]